MRALFPPGFVASWFAVLIATHAYGQESGLQEAIQRHLAKHGPVVEAPRTLMADLDGNGNAEAVVSYCINENPEVGKIQERVIRPRCIARSLSSSRKTRDGLEQGR